jgi:hypothetical protein
MIPRRGPTPSPGPLAARALATKSPRDIERCLKRILARQLFRLLERYDRPSVEILKIA